MLIAVTIVGFGIVIFQIAALRHLFVDIVKQLRMLNIRADREADGDMNYVSVAEEAQATIDIDAGIYR